MQSKFASLLFIMGNHIIHFITSSLDIITAKRKQEIMLCGYQLKNAYNYKTRFFETKQGQLHYYIIKIILLLTLVVFCLTQHISKTTTVEMNQQACY